jgi:hypothetical protein
MMEAVLQRLILAHLGNLPRVWAWRANTGGAHRDGGFVRFGLPGQGDITGVVKLPSGVGLRLEIECKSHGKGQSPAQVAFGRRAREMGVLYIVAYSLEDALGPIRKLTETP